MIPFLAFHPIMYTISEVTVGGLVFKKKSKIQVIVSVVPCVVNFIGNTILVPFYGGRGAAISTGISYILFLQCERFCRIGITTLTIQLNVFLSSQFFQYCLQLMQHFTLPILC